VLTGVHSEVASVVGMAICRIRGGVRVAAITSVPSADNFICNLSSPSRSKTCSEMQCCMVLHMSMTEPPPTETITSASHACASTAAARTLDKGECSPTLSVIPTQRSPSALANPLITSVRALSVREQTM
jgi:hypothetical protein